MSFVRLLAELATTDLALAGGKGANLGALLRAGFPVPPGFCITTGAYRAFVAANTLQDEIMGFCNAIRADDPAALEAASAAIRARFAAGQVPADLATEIRLAYAALDPQSASAKRNPPVAVRSSATAEDLPDMSFAGQQDTFLNVVGEEALLHAVVRCWSSLWTARAIGYRARNGIPSAEVALAVVVQQMVPSEAAGVLFTANPLTGKRHETVIDATLGLGEALVSGQVEPDHYVVDAGVADAGWRIVSKTLGAKALSLRGQSEGGTVMMREDAAARQALPDAAILELARAGRRAEQALGGPQDIEWAWAGGQLSLVQARPITSLYPSLTGIRADDLLALFSLGAMQGMLDPFTPLGNDAFRLMMVAFGRLFGVEATVDTERAMLEAGGRLFLNFTPLFRNRPGRSFLNVYCAAIDPGSRGALDALLSDPRLAVQGGRMKLRTRWGFMRILAPLAVNVIRNLIAPARGRARLQQAIEALVGDIAARHTTVKTLAERVAVVEEMVEQMPPVFFSRLIPAVACGQAPLQILLRLCADLPDGERTVLELTRGLPYNVTTEMDLALWAAARAIKTDAVAVQHFALTDAATLAAEYLRGTLPPAAQAALGSFMQHYGMRGVGEIDMGRPRWREDPTSLIQALGSYLLIGDEAVSPAAVFQRGATSAEIAKGRLAAMLARTPGGKMKARLARVLAGRVRELTGLRESPKLAAIRAMTAQREGLLATGRDLVATAVLERPEDLFFLRLADLKALAGGAQRDWQALVAERRGAYEREKRRRRVPRVLLSDGTAFYEGLGATSEAGSAAIVGSPVSPGVVEGVVHVVFDPRGARLTPGEILVCPGTDPAWTPLFLAAGGLVMEVGGMMTHGSVVAREYGIPAVVGVNQATTRLQTGQRIRLDGSSGQIVVLGTVD